MGLEQAIERFDQLARRYGGYGSFDLLTDGEEMAELRDWLVELREARATAPTPPAAPAPLPTGEGNGQQGRRSAPKKAVVKKTVRRGRR